MDQEEQKEKEASLDLPPKLDRPLSFDPTRMMGIIKRKALIKDLAAAYHKQCLGYCQELLELQLQSQEPFTDVRIPEDTRKAPKRLKKSR